MMIEGRRGRTARTHCARQHRPREKDAYTTKAKLKLKVNDER
jgi:hypothetical protein